MCNDLRIRLRDKLISMLFKLLLKLQIILNNTVMDNNDTLITVKMRMGVRIGRRTMGSPSCMPDPHRSGKRCSVMRQFAQYLKPALRLHHIDLPAVTDCDPRGIIPSILKFGQTVQKDRRSLPVTNISYYSTHYLHSC